ncbi:hypothetical protein ACIQFZ_18840 [Streptomyces sp. NPDC093064]|uniref:hypothetical protein n=1 Tax=Streptomyces sp. NPDC093064 TaxID=3366020 RepID=UPI0037F8C827
MEAGFEPAHIVFDSPAKTRAELVRALSLGVAVNADNFQELSRLDEILATRRSDSRIGVRRSGALFEGHIGALLQHSSDVFGFSTPNGGSRFTTRL